MIAALRGLAGHGLMALALFGWVGWVGWAAVAHAAVDATPRATTDSGVVQGARLEDGVAVFRGLPYAAAPVGARRWRAPQPPPRWPGVRAAERFGPACMQKPGLSLEGGGDPGALSEDCLSLNVWVPADAQRGARAPVMVWLHGGALVFGAGSLKLYDGHALARRGVVVVTLNYRLGPLGYFAHPALDAATPGGPVNFGLLDQIAALRWVRENIAAFGGDAKQVTLLGQSAGAQSVLALMASPQAQGLFQRAVAQSPYGIPSHSRAQARATGVRLTEAAGLPGARATLRQLRALPAARLFELEGQGLSLAPSLVVGDAAMPRTILAAFQAGQQAAVPLVIGSNSDETSVALAFGLDPATVVQKLGAARFALQTLYADVDNDSELGRQAMRDLAFGAFARRIAVLQSKRAPVWRYYFDRLPEQQRGQQAGVAHGGEVPALFGTAETCGCMSTPLSDADRLAWQGLADRWLAFARSGQPHRAAQPLAPDWPTDTLRRPVVMVFGPDGSQAQPGFMAARLNLLIGALNLLARPVAAGK